ncbi:MAG: putative peptide modification system cyclase [Rhizobium sp.]|nr:putative peptide modification system cyclase [Rhizobium sp.]
MDVFESRTPGNPAAPAVKPMLRAVLVCDIVESTALVERLGDVRAAGFLQKHDQLMLQAMKLCHGQLVDKADGVLALFERPIQALDFALRYQRGLYELGKSEGFDLKARTGIHVGDVMTWANDAKDVLAGAKPFEVEGLAKPVAARLMGLALPGQILMSGMAQNLAQRAAGELGERAGRLRWLMHGRYRFKGVPAPMLVHEVGEPGIAPLRPPDSGAKAWRELPLWRRPPALAAEALLLLALGSAVLWSTFRSEPAIAFAERDWVVVADVQNRTGEVLLDGALDAALRVGLEQSRHVNLISEMQLQRALQRMQREGQPVDRQLAVELALREGARAVILPTVSEVGGVVRVSMELIDPGSGVTVHSESADARASDHILPALDVVMSGVRAELGEALSSIGESSQPLEKVTTADMEALRLYSLALQARWRGRDAEARDLLTEALQRDPDFSMAWLRLGAVELGGDMELAAKHFARAQMHRERLTRREELLLDATMGLLGDPRAMLGKWRTFALLYPDEYRAYYNYSYFAHFTRHEFIDAAEFIEPALVPQNPQRPGAHYLKGTALLAGNQVDRALVQFEAAASLGLGWPRREHADAYAAKRDYVAARRLMGDTASGTGVTDPLLDRLPEASWALDQGRWQEAMASLVAIGQGLDAAPADARLRHRVMVLSLRAYVPDDGLVDDLRVMEADLASASETANAIRRPQLDFLSLGVAWVAAHNGESRLAKDILARVGPGQRDSGFAYLEDMYRVVEAEIEIARGNPEGAIEYLAPRRAAGNEMLFLRAVLARAYATHGKMDEALREAEWVASQRGRAYAEPTVEYAWMMANLVENNLALQQVAWYSGALGNEDAAKRLQATFDRAWPAGKDLPAVLRRRPSAD